MDEKFIHHCYAYTLSLIFYTSETFILLIIISTTGHFILEFYTSRKFILINIIFPPTGNYALKHSYTNGKFTYSF
jgi:hypothetical protein